MGRYDGYVYAIVDRSAGAVKIGKAAFGTRWGRDDNLYQRYSEATNWNADPYRLWVHSESVHDNAYQAEREAHRLLAHARRKGPGHEWFSLSDPAVAEWLLKRHVVDMPLEERRQQVLKVVQEQRHDWLLLAVRAA